VLGLQHLQPLGLSPGTRRPDRRSWELTRTGSGAEERTNSTTRADRATGAKATSAPPESGRPTRNELLMVVHPGWSAR